jgi:hypothetical protein
MVGLTCDKCTLAVPAEMNTCGMCMSWRCPRCEWFSRSMIPSCELCQTPRPPPVFGGHGAPPASQNPQQQKPPIPQPPAPPRVCAAQPLPPQLPPRPGVDPSSLYPAYQYNPLQQNAVQPPRPQPVPWIPPAAPIAVQPQWTAPAAAQPQPPVPRPGPPSAPPPSEEVACLRCTFLNPASATRCAMCSGPMAAAPAPRTPVAASPSPPAPSQYVTASPPPQAALAPVGASNALRSHSTALVADHDFHDEINEARRLCRAARTHFVAIMNSEEHRTLEWGSIFHHLKPGVPQVAQAIAARDAFLVNLARLMGRGGGGYDAAGHRAQRWHVFPPHGISADDIAQGELGDCWFLSAVAVLAHSRPSLIQKLFLVTEVNEEGVFAVRLWCDGEWRPFLVDGNFPTLYGGKLFRYGRCKRNDAIWVPLLEKAYAMMHGSYAAIVAGQLDEAFYDLTGLPCERLRIHAPEGTARNGAPLLDPDEVFAKMASFQSGQCTMGASCGCTDSTDQTARAVGLSPRHCYSLLEVGVDPRTGEKLVRIRNPWGHSAYHGVAPPQDGIARAEISGAVWLPYTLFLSCFSDVVVCYTREFAGGVVSVPRCLPSTGFFPPLRSGAGGGADISGVGLHVAEATLVRVMAVQAKLRGEGRRNQGYFDVALFLMKIDAQGRAAFIASSTGLCDRVVTFDRMLDPGLYAIFPFSLQQHAATNPRLVLNVLCESDRVAPLQWEDVVPARLPLGRLLYNFLANDRRHLESQDSSQTGVWTVRSWKRGTLRFELIESRSSNASVCTIDAANSFGSVIEPHVQRQVELPARGAAVAIASSVAAHSGSYSFQYSHRWSMTERLNPAAIMFGAFAAAPVPTGADGALTFSPFAL